MESFGEFIKECRIKLGKTLREFCLENGLDPGNVSKLERGKLPPYDSTSKLTEYARYLKLKENSPQWQNFFDLASIERGKFPKDLQNNDAVLMLPLLFRKIRKGKFTRKELKKLARIIQEA